MFSVFGNIKINESKKTIFGQHKKYGLFLEIIFHLNFLENNSISQQSGAAESIGHLGDGLRPPLIKRPPNSNNILYNII